MMSAAPFAFEDRMEREAAMQWHTRLAEGGGGAEDRGGVDLEIR